MDDLNEYHPVAVFLSEVMRCEQCGFPCEMKENASMASCQRHLDQLVKSGKVRITVTWQDVKEIPIIRR